jgi:hypothetical protein
MNGNVKWVYDLVTNYEELLDSFKKASFDDERMKSMGVSDFKLANYSGIEEDEREIELFGKPEEYTLYDFYQFTKKNRSEVLHRHLLVDGDRIELDDGNEITIFINFEYRWSECESWISDEDGDLLVESDDEELKIKVTEEAKLLCRGEYVTSD